MTNSSLSNHSSSTTGGQVQGITEIRQKTIAALIARGFSVKYVAKKLKISEDRIYHLFSDKNSLVNAEINRFFNDAFAASDRRLINLYDKALKKLDAMLSSSDEETQCRAIDRIIKIYLTRSTKNAVTIQQYFGIQSKEEKGLTVDELVLKRSKERGLPMPTVQKRSSDQIQKDSSDSSPDDSSQGDSSLDNFSTEDYTLDDSANASSPNDSFPDPSSPALQEFLEKIK